MKIKLDSNVRGITQVACMHISGVIQNLMAQTGKDELIIFPNKIVCRKGWLSSVNYNFGSNLCCVNGVIDYVGFNQPIEPDNQMIYDELYSYCGFKKQSIW